MICTSTDYDTAVRDTRRAAVYVLCENGARSCTSYCSGKEVRITHCECVFVALDASREMP